MQIYKYLGLLFDECVTFNDSIKMIAECWKSSGDNIVSKFKHTKDIRYNAYMQSYVNVV